MNTNENNAPRNRNVFAVVHKDRTRVRTNDYGTVVSIKDHLANLAMNDDGVIVALGKQAALNLVNFILEIKDIDKSNPNDQAVYALAERLSNHYGFHVDKETGKLIDQNLYFSETRPALIAS